MQNLYWMRQQEFRQLLRRNLGKLYVYAIGVDGYHGNAGTTVKYIGKGKKFRALAHLTELRGKSSSLRLVHKGIIKWHSNIRFALVSWCESDKEALDLEVEIIRNCGRENLWNLTDGGEGASNPSAETIRKRSLSIKAAFSKPEVKEKLSASQKAAWQDEEYRSRMISMRRAKSSDPEWIKKMRESTRLAFSTPEIRAIRSRAAVETNARPEVKEKISFTSKAMWRISSYRDRISVARRAMWESEEFRRKAQSAMRDAAARPDVKMKVSAASSRNWGNPEYVAKMKEKRRSVWECTEYRERMSTVRREQMSKPERRAAASLSARIRGLYSRLSGVPYRKVVTSEARKYLIEAGHMTQEGVFT